MTENTGTDKTEAEAAFEAKAKTLRGDTRDWLLDQFRRLDKPWHNCSELEQRRLIDGAEEMARQAIRRIVDLVAQYEWPTVSVRFAGEGKFKGAEVELKLTTGLSSDNLTKLSAGAGQAVLVMVDPSQFFGQRRPAWTIPDQPEIDLGDQATGEQRETAPGGIPLDEAEKKFTAAKTAAEAKTSKQEAEGEERGRAACDAGKERSCPRSSAKFRDGFLRGYDARGVELAREAIRDGADPAQIVRRMKEVGVVVPDELASAISGRGQAGEAMPDAPDRELADA